MNVLEEFFCTAKLIIMIKTPNNTAVLNNVQFLC